MYKLEMGTSDLANDLHNSISAQQFVIKRDLQSHIEADLATDQSDGNNNGEDESETGSLPADDALEEVFDSPVSLTVPKRPTPVRPAPAVPAVQSDEHSLRPPTTEAWEDEPTTTTDDGKIFIYCIEIIV